MFVDSNNQMQIVFFAPNFYNIDIGLFAYVEQKMYTYIKVYFNLVKFSRTVISDMCMFQLFINSLNSFSQGSAALATDALSYSAEP